MLKSVESVNTTENLAQNATLMPEKAYNSIASQLRRDEREKALAMLRSGRI